MCQRYIGSVTAMRDEDAPDPRGIVPRIEGMPLAAEVHLDPSSKIHGRIRRRKTEVRNVPCAVARRDVQAATESDRQMREVAANSATLGICFECCSGWSRVLVSENHMVVHEVTYGLHPQPAERHMSKETPGIFGKAISLAVAAAEQKLKVSAGKCST
jgi:hypothetical protein